MIFSDIEYIVKNEGARIIGTPSFLILDFVSTTRIICIHPNF